MNKDVAQEQKDIFSNNLIRYMNRFNVNQADIVADLGITASTVSDWVNAKKYPRVDKMQRLADYIGVSISDLREPPQTNIIQPTGMVPVYGQIAAGLPILAVENIEGYYPVMVRNPDEHFYLRVKGNSMVGAGIVDGSLVLIHKQPCAENGQIVACRVNGDEATLKRFKQQGDIVILLPENAAYEPQIVPCSAFESGEAEIIGVAVLMMTSIL